MSKKAHEEHIRRCTVPLRDAVEGKMGTGFFVGRGLIVTAKHVVPSGRAIVVWKDREYRADGLPTTLPADVAVLSVPLHSHRKVVGVVTNSLDQKSDLGALAVPAKLLLLCKEVRSARQVVRLRRALPRLGPGVLASLALLACLSWGKGSSVAEYVRDVIARRTLIPWRIPTAPHYPRTITVAVAYLDGDKDGQIEQLVHPPA